MMNPKVSAPPRGSLERPVNRVASLLEAEKPSPMPGLMFPSNYSEARERFLESAERLGCHTESWGIPQRGPAGEDLSIDLARWGPADTKRWLLVSSGLHGTEGPLGSAVQLAFLDWLRDRRDIQDVGVVLLHGLNPYGYAWRRRNNEDNVDLNRNFLLPGEEYSGVHPLYQYVYRQFEPSRVPRRYESFLLKAWWIIMRHSLAALQTSLPVGQYEFPKGLFFGGHRPALLQQLLRCQLRANMPDAEEVVHLDFHTGLGKWATCKLIIDVDLEHHDGDWFSRWVPSRDLECAATARTAYLARGALGPWLHKVIFPGAAYRYATVEFGTYGPVRVLKSLFDELRVHFSCDPDDPRYERVKRLVCETFVPASPLWRRATLSCGLDFCRRLFLALHHPAPVLAA
jgi:hypothetical protein